MTDTNLEMWWPSPEAFDDLNIEDTDFGFSLSAPDGTECAEWLNYWNQSEDHEKTFGAEFMKAILDFVNLTENTDGQAEAVSDEQDRTRIETEEDSSGSLS